MNSIKEQIEFHESEAGRLGVFLEELQATVLQSSSRMSYQEVVQIKLRMQRINNAINRHLSQIESLK